MSPLPFFLVFLVAFLTAPTLLFAAAVPGMAPELRQRDGGDGQQTAAQGLAAPFAEEEVNRTAADAEKGVYFCTSAFWNADASGGDAACFYDVVSSPSSSGTAGNDDENDNDAAAATTAAGTVAVSDPCVRLRSTTAAAQGKPRTSWYRNVGSFAPDGGVACVVYDADDCTGASLRITAPGFADLGVVGWARRIASYACVVASSSDTSTSSGGSWFGNGNGGGGGQ
ncbi:hypothetical protein HDK77DRAFT_473955 [Phyllosticta capitalensis]|uniref:Uncharacterized protein n=1 Tax=Phyllosticta capitalensis TaxID=121624 RepID=A0ABR1YLF2_9PEZI